MAPCAKYQYVLTDGGPKIIAVPDKESKVEESPVDYNPGGYLPVKVNDSFKHGRYHVLRKLGWGHFSTVWLVKDSQLNRHSAIKVVKSAGRYAETARDEIKLLSRVAMASPTHLGRTHIVSFLDSFSHSGPEASHICIVFEPLGENLLALIERHKKKGVPRPLVKVIAKQILLGLEYLHDECDLIHTDIKPENILISIPDIESHIHAELSLNPSPTSRRVGVPLPTPATKSRTGLSIPHQHSVRRQVHIFDSQPLTSPQRTASIVPSSPSRSIDATGGGDPSGTNSTSASYVTQMHMSRLASSTKLSTSAPKRPVSVLVKTPQLPPSPSLVSSPASTRPPVSAALEKSMTSAATHPTSPSTSTVSSYSSLSLTSTAAGSTPATSVSLKMGLSCVHEMDKVESDSMLANGDGNNRKDSALRGGLRIKNMVGLSAQLESTMPSLRKDTLPKLVSYSGVPDISLWKDSPSRLGLSRKVTWKDRDQILSISLNERWRDHRDGAVSAGSTGLKDKARSGSLIHDGKLSSSWKEKGTPSTSWKGKHKRSATWSLRDPMAKFLPGTSEPAPAVLVSASVSREGAIQSVTTSTVDGKSTRTNASLLFVSNKTVSRSPSATSPLLTIPSSPSASATTSSASTITSSSSTTKTGHGHQPSLLTRTDPRNIPSRQSLSHRPPTSTTHTSHLANTHTCPVLASPTTPPPTPYSEASGAPPISIKIADLGNATPSRKHYTEDIQTRQYRAPEAIVGRRDWGSRVDVWSVACVVFELLTAEYLFDPQGQGELFTKDDDHMAQIIELLGDFPLEAKMGGRYSRELFDHTGTLRYIRTLKPWPLKRVMTEKYLFKEEDTSLLCAFLEPMLTPDMTGRSEAREMVSHPWLEVTEADGEVVEW